APSHGGPPARTDPPAPTAGSIRRPNALAGSTPATRRITAARDRDSRTASQIASTPGRPPHARTAPGSPAGGVPTDPGLILLRSWRHLGCADVLRAPGDEPVANARPDLALGAPAGDEPGMSEVLREPLRPGGEQPGLVAAAQGIVDPPAA